MPPVNSTYWTFKRVLTASSGVGLSVVALFTLLSLSGALNVTGYSYTEHCAGTPSDLCYLYLNFTPTKDIYIQADSQWLNTESPIKTIKLQRSWGNSWRTIDLTKTWSTKVKYAVKFSKGVDYQIRFVATKYDPRDVINWSINPEGTWGRALPKMNCDYDIQTKTKEVNHWKEETKYSKENKTYYNITVLDYIEKIKYEVNNGCKKDTKRIEYAEYKLKYKKEGLDCNLEECDKICEVNLIDGMCTDYPDYELVDGITTSKKVKLKYTDKIELVE